MKRKNRWQFQAVLKFWGGGARVDRRRWCAIRTQSLPAVGRVGSGLAQSTDVEAGDPFLRGEFVVQTPLLGAQSEVDRAERLTGGRCRLQLLPLCLGHRDHGKFRKQSRHLGSFGTRPFRFTSLVLIAVDRIFPSYRLKQKNPIHKQIRFPGFLRQLAKDLSFPCGVGITTLSVVDRLVESHRANSLVSSEYLWQCHELLLGYNKSAVAVKRPGCGYS